MFRANNFDKLLDKATSNLRLDPDWPTILQICDLIRQNDCTPKYAVAALKKKLASQNPHQAMFALLVLESIVKNCGSGIHDEVATKAFCEMLRDLVKTSQHDNLRTKILELIQAWAFAFRNTPKYRAVQDMVNILKAEGHKFPPLKESDAMFSADTAPEWADGEVCHRCRVAFSLMLRRHHCRACGQVFCQQCSSKTSTIPKYGIEKEVRVCDACYDKMSRPPAASPKLEIVDTGSDYGPAQQPQKRPGKSAEELQEEEELQLALALSQSEAEHKEKERKTRPYITPESAPQQPSVSPTPSSVSASPEHSTGTNAELSRYLDRGYWEQRLTRDTSSAPTAPSSHTPAPSDDYAKNTTSKLPDEEAEDRELDEFVGNLKTQVEIFVNRMKSNSSRGRSIANDSSVQTLFMNITAMHSRLLQYIQQQDDKRVYLESLQDKVTQVRDSRAALDTLRAEHTARLAAAAEAAERQRQMQMAAKLQAMRKKKHEYLQYQRQLALQRVQEQEREMQMRQEQQKHQYMMSANAGFYMPGVSMHQYQQGYPNQPLYANPQYQPQMLPQATTDAPMSMPGQTKISQANMPLGVSQMGAVSQSLPQISQPYPNSTAGITAAISTQANLNQTNLRTSLGQQLPMQSQLMMQHPMQMRMPIQSGVQQMLPQNMANGVSGPHNVPQTANQQPSQLSKQAPSSQPQPGSLMNQMGQQNFVQSQLNSANPLLSMQMQNMRIPLNQGGQINPSTQSSMPGFSMTHIQTHNNQQPGPPSHGMQPQQQMALPSQMTSLPGQQMLPGQMQGQNQSLPQIVPTSQSLSVQGNQVPSQNQSIQPLGHHPQVSQGQPMIFQGQPSPHVQTTQGQAMSLQGSQVPHSQALQGQTIPIQGHQVSQLQASQNQAMSLQGQQISYSQANQGQVISQQSQQTPQTQANSGQLMSLQNQSMPISGQMQGQHMLPPGQQVQSQQHMSHQGQQMLNQGQGPMQAPQTLNQGQPVPNSGQQMSMHGQLQQQISQGRMQIPQHGPNMQQQGQGTTQGIPSMKIQQQNVPQTPIQQSAPNQQSQAQTPIKSEHNNNTAELISFD